MSRSANQKLKLLYIAEYLLSHSDEAHPVSTPALISYLASLGISAERKSIYDDISALQDFGLDIERCGSGRSSGWYAASQKFELPELKLLVDSVQSANFISRRKTEALIRKIESLTSIHQAKTLQRQVITAKRIKTMNESVFYSIDAIHDAISADRQIRYRYFDYAADKSKQFRRDGAFYRVSPFALIWDNENYYLLAYDPDAVQLRHYRVDRMESISVLPLPREGHALFQQVDMAIYTRQVFDMFSGQSVEVKLRFHNSLAGAVLDHFGQEVFLIPDGPDCFTLRTRVEVSPRFFAWLCAFGTKARLLEPVSVVEQLQEHLAGLSRMYQG